MGAASGVVAKRRSAHTIWHFSSLCEVSFMTAVPARFLFGHLMHCISSALRHGLSMRYVGAPRSSAIVAHGRYFMAAIHRLSCAYTAVRPPLESDTLHAWESYAIAQWPPCPCGGGEAANPSLFTLRQETVVSYFSALRWHLTLAESTWRTLAYPSTSTVLRFMAVILRSRRPVQDRVLLPSHSEHCECRKKK